MKEKYLSILLMASSVCMAQDFAVQYISYPETQNHLVMVDLDTYQMEEIFICPPTHNSNQAFEVQYTDIAMDGAYFYFVSGWGSLYRRAINDEGSCEFLGTFGVVINSLGVDDGKNIYAAGYQDSISHLYKYSIEDNSFTFLGNFPSEINSAGDLFFYEEKLFLTAKNWDNAPCSLYEVNMVDPSESCYYMSLETYNSFGAFSVDHGTYSKAYIVHYLENSQTSELVELDMENKNIQNTLTAFSFPAMGAAFSYNLTAENTVCTTAGIKENPAANYFNVSNPASGKLQIDTDLNVMQVLLYDAPGKEVRRFDSIDATDISGLPQGIYLLKAVTGTGIISKKIIIM